MCWEARKKLGYSIIVLFLLMSQLTGIFLLSKISIAQSEIAEPRNEIEFIKNDYLRKDKKKIG